MTGNLSRKAVFSDCYTVVPTSLQFHLPVSVNHGQPPNESIKNFRNNL